MLTFDGAVVEAFGSCVIAYWQLPSSRVHIRQLAVTVKGPDKHGKRTLEFKRRQTMSGLRCYADEQEWVAAQQLLEALRAAGADFSSD